MDINKGSQLGVNKNEEENDEEDNGSSSGDFQQTFKSRKNLSAVLNDLEVPATIKNVKYVGNILTLVILVLAFTDYFITATQMRVS